MHTESTSSRAETPVAERGQEPAPRRVNTPRVGSFITIAAALLMLFGAASRLGKESGAAPMFGIDTYAESRVREEDNRVSSQIGRYNAALTLGSVPVSEEPVDHTIPINHNATPPPRQEVDLDALRRRAVGDRPVVSIATPDTRQDETEFLSSQFNGGSAPDRGLRPPTQAAAAQPPAAPQPARVESYVVEPGDTWVKIAKRTLGDANRWRDIQSANPGTANGLEVGMKLKIPR